MGTGIAQVAAQSGFTIIQFDVSDDMLQKSKSSIENSLQRLLEREKINVTQKTEILQRIHFTSSIDNCVADIIIEAVVEKKEVKQQLFDKLSLTNNHET